jgi:hypothetical protein
MLRRPREGECGEKTWNVEAAKVKVQTTALPLQET